MMQAELLSNQNAKYVERPTLPKNLRMSMYNRNILMSIRDLSHVATETLSYLKTVRRFNGCELRNQQATFNSKLTGTYWKTEKANVSRKLTGMYVDHILM